MKRHVILVGLPGAGKTTIGKLVAGALGAAFVDLDQAIERRAGKSIAGVFGEEGEAAFRERERAEMENALSMRPGVIAAGGGWAAQPGNLEAVAGRGLTVYLRVTPDVAAGRVTMSEPLDSMSDRRPLLAGGDVAARVSELYRARRAFYECSEAAVEAGGAEPETVAQEVVKLARSLAGWY